jgi:hypothetical protein
MPAGNVLRMKSTYLRRVAKDSFFAIRSNG